MVRAAIALLLLVLLPSVAQAEKRIALLIGNQAYVPAIGALKNPLNDIVRVGAALEKVGFEIIIVKAASFSQLNRAINSYIRRLNAAGSGAIGFFYYTGHGAQQKETGTNYLIPVDVQSIDHELWDASLRLKSVTDALKDQAPNATHFVVFDACRNSLRLAEPGSKALVQAKGFEPVRVVPGMLIAYATAEGEVASDVGESVGPYARFLAEEIVKPDVEAVSMFRSVQLRVRDTIHQEPWLSYGALSPVWFAGRNEARPPIPVPPPTTATPSRSSEAAEAWDRTKDTTNIAVLEAFIARFKDTFLAELARARVEELRKQRDVSALPPRAKELPAASKPVENQPITGLVLTPLSTQLREKHNIDKNVKGVMVLEVDPTSPSAEKGVKVGDVIVEVAQEAVSSLYDIAKSVDKVKKAGRKAVLLRLNDREHGMRFVALPVQ